MADGTSQPSPPRFDRRAIVLTTTGLVVAGALIAMLSYPSWSRPAPAPISGHWLAVRRGRAYLQQNRPDLALEAVAKVRDEAPGAGEAMCVAGLALAQMEQFRSARIALERSLSLQPKQPMAAKVLSAIHLSMGDSTQGLSCLRKAAELSPNDFRPWFTMGKVHLDLGESEEAAAAYRQAMLRNGKDVDTRIGLIEALLALGRAEEAFPIVKETLALDPKRAKLLGLAAKQARDSGQDTEAIRFADQALEIDPDEIEALFVRAHLRHASGQSLLALADIERVVSINPNQLSGLNLLAQIESRLGLNERAARTADRRREASQRLASMDALTKEIANRPDDPEPRWKLGLAAVDGGQRTLAANCFQAALAVDPDFQPARESLSALNSPRSVRNADPIGP
ncbi:tetratricopeptide repeat protein [Tundrisphaera lichenicola]|uniref:tetratricopeptide repeat protein n=1 Tax=Tundrisphaera lichenicola TaxID=2029860 RepID=UPI003EBC602E